MGLTLRWAGEDELDRVAETRHQCYATIRKELDIYKRWLRDDHRGRPGDFLLAERDGAAVGTATSLSVTMWVRGAALPAQGVAWVGTIKTHRRRMSDPADRGIASKIMAEVIRKARERGQVISALMPFRASFYEHFGYGLVERLHEWTLPLSVLPTGDCSGMEFMTPGDLPAIKQCRQRMVQAGQCDIERTDAGWQIAAEQWQEGFCVVDRAEDASIRSWMYLNEVPQPGQTRLLRVMDAVWDSQQAFQRQLSFLASLRDQYSTAAWIVPADLALNRLLKEPQIPHRPVSHATARMAVQTRMQVRILDHVRFLNALNLPKEVSGSARVLISEPEGEKRSISVEFEGGRAMAKPSTSEPQVVCSASVWASIACGDLSASAAARLGLIEGTDSKALKVLNALSTGPAPFCTEYF